MIKKLIFSIAGILLFGLSAVSASASTPNWNILGTWTFNDIYQSVPYVHTMVIDSFNPTTGDFSGHGSYNNDSSLTWNITGNENGNDISFNLLTGGSVPGVTLNGMGIVNSATTMGGTGFQSNLPEPAPNVDWSAIKTPNNCEPTGFFRDGIDLTAAVIATSTTVSGDIDATGCHIGVFYGPGINGEVNGANIFGASYYGVVVQKAAVDVKNSNIHNIGEFPFNGSQHGVGIYYANVDGKLNGDCSTDGNTSGMVDKNTINLYQKGGVVVVCRNTYVSVTNNTVTGLGPVNFIAQNGIQFGYGAMGLARGNTIDGGNEYTGTGWTSTALLLFDVNAKDVKTSNNKFIHNQTNHAVVTSQSCPHMYGGFYESYGLCLFP